MTIVEPAGTQQVIQVASDKISAAAAQVITVGEVVRVTVRTKDQSGEGQLAIRGNIINAQLPTTLEVGANFFAKVIAENNKLIFQIVDQALEAQLISQELLSVNSMLEDLLQDAILKGITTLEPYTLEQPDQAEEKNTRLKLNFKDVGDIYKSLLKELGLNEEVASSADLIKLLQNSSSGESTKILKNFLEEINQTIGSSVQQKQIMLLKELSNVFEKFIHLDSKNFPLQKELLNQSWDILNKLQITQHKQTESNKPQEKETVEKELVEKLKINFRNIKDSSENSIKIVQGLNNLIQEELKNSPAAQSLLSEKTIFGLQHLQQHLEQMVNTQEFVNNLNPVMQLMGEPALVLFPFIFQGLLNQSEIKINPDENKKKKNSSGKNDKSKIDTELFRRIQVNVPLPSMGGVGVDIAYRKEEIFIKFTLENTAAATFLNEQIENLVGILRANNFQKAEISTQVGKPDSTEIFPWFMEDQVISLKA